MSDLNLSEVAFEGEAQATDSESKLIDTDEMDNTLSLGICDAILRFHPSNPIEPQNIVWRLGQHKTNLKLAPWRFAPTLI